MQIAPIYKVVKMTYNNKIYCNKSLRGCYNDECPNFLSYRDLLNARKEAGDREPNIDFDSLDIDCTRDKKTIS